VSAAPPRVADAWTPDQLERRAQAEQFQCVVANVRKGADAELIAWAKAKGCFVYIGRGARGYRAGVWANTAEIVPPRLRHDREAHLRAVAAYARLLAEQDELFARVPELRGGRVLGCWCHPLPCHGHLLAEFANRHAAGEGAVEQLAKGTAEVMALSGAGMKGSRRMNAVNDDFMNYVMMPWEKLLAAIPRNKDGQIKALPPRPADPKAVQHALRQLREELDASRNKTLVRWDP
jgi:hypothetical protein